MGLRAAGLTTRKPLLVAACFVAVATIVLVAILMTRSHRQGLFSDESPWNSALGADAHIDPSSRRRVDALATRIEAAQRNGLWPAVTFGAYSVPVYVVGDDAPSVPVRLDTGPWGKALARALASGVPIPSVARPAPGTDGHLVIWEPSTDRLWEFWQAVRRRDGWHASWGGAMRQVSASPGYYSDRSWPGLRSNEGWNWGATATSLPVIAGLGTLEELRRGRIDHALAASVPEACAGVFAFPAQRTDGQDGRSDCMPAGARLRLDPRLDLRRLRLSPIARVLARAAQRYGIIVRDTTHGSFAFYTQIAPGGGEGLYTGSRTVWGGAPSWKALDGFPWRRLQLMASRLCRAAPCRPPNG